MPAGRNAVRAIPVFLALAVLATRVLGAVNSQAQTKLEIRLAEEQPGTGLVEASVSHSDRHVYLQQSAVITNEDVTNARVVPAGAAFSVAISLTPQGGEKMANATLNHIGRPLAILVNGTVVTAPTLRGAVGQVAIIMGDFTRQEADEIAALLSGR